MTGIPERGVGTRPLPPALAGALAAGAALGIGELTAGLVSAGSSLVVAVGDLVIDFAPPAVEDAGISIFGTNDKPALVVGIVVLSLLFGAVIGRIAARSFRAGAAGFAAFGLLGAWAGLRSPTMELGPLVAAVAAGAGIAALWMLLQVGERPAPAGPIDDPSEHKAGASRRGFLLATGAAAGVAVAAAASGRWLLDRSRRVLASGRADVVLPVPGEPVAAPGPAASFAVTDLTPIVVPNDEFYRIDTALVVPRIEVQEWQLDITGMVNRPYSLNFRELTDMPMEEHYVTLSCVSNQVGGDLVGNARWLGVPLADLLDRAGVDPAATQIVGRAVDDFTVGFPTAAALDGRIALVAVGMNGEPLPFEHGFPARLVVEGLYGYVSATKWLAEIELTTLEDFDAYWVPRGWAKEAPIKTQSRIDVPAGRRIAAGRQPVAGVAWAPGRGISRVEVRVDDGAWQPAELSAPLSDAAWVQWLWEWDATDGDHVIEVRATDGDGVAQTEERTSPRPDGATGWHTIRVRVEAT